MKSVLLFTTAILWAVLPASAQFDMLGKDIMRICSKIDNDPEYEAKIDTLDVNTILVTCRGAEKYPYYTYEIDVERDECVCVGVVSRNREVFDAYVNMLTSFGKLVERDSAMVNFKYVIYKKAEGNSASHCEKLYLSVMQPYRNSSLLSQRNIFSITLSKSGDSSSAE
jgi:hypothetical protein